MPGRHDADHSTNWIGQSRSRLALRRSEKPATKAGQIRALWPEIAAALEAGQSLKSIRQWLEEDAGIAVGVTSLTSYISRIRRREVQQRTTKPLPNLRPTSRPKKQWRRILVFRRFGHKAEARMPFHRSNHNTIRSPKPSTL